MKFMEKIGGFCVMIFLTITESINYLFIKITTKNNDSPVDGLSPTGFHQILIKP